MAAAMPEVVVTAVAVMEAAVMAGVGEVEGNVVVVATEGGARWAMVEAVRAAVAMAVEVMVAMAWV